MNTYWTKRYTLRRLASWVWLASGLACFSFASAQSDVGAKYQQDARTWTLQTLEQSTPSGAALRYEVVVGEVDRRLKLAPCGSVEYYVPTGGRLWGNTRLAMRCVDGMTRWNVTLPVKVRAIGKAWVVKNPVSPGSEVRDADLVVAEVDWFEESAAVLVDRSQWVGYVAARNLNTGVALRNGALKAAQAFQAGAQVRVLANGIGFQVSAEAMALSVGVVGQVARVKMDNGRITSGTVLDARTVRVDM